ncbi:MAG: rRNA maturation RNase YbeY [Thermoleophilia bacterium]|nr:rRNA maturation RNase YbeY [Thermoleophilia bacterium]
MAVEVVDRTGTERRLGRVAELVEAVLDAEGAAGTVVVAFVNEEEMTALNGRYRGLNEPTDVLSFRYGEDEGAWSEAPGAVAELGEVVVCPSVVHRYAEEEGGDPGRQLAWTLVHGVLHLVGYDHESDNGEMRKREQALLGRLDRLVTAVSPTLPH